jgi:hypothetical protein
MLEQSKEWTLAFAIGDGRGKDKGSRYMVKITHNPNQKHGTFSPVSWRVELDKDRPSCLAGARISLKQSRTVFFQHQQGNINYHVFPTRKSDRMRCHRHFNLNKMHGQSLKFVMKCHSNS